MDALPSRAGQEEEIPKDVAGRGIRTPDGEALLVGSYDGARNSVWSQPLAGEPRRLDLGSLSTVSGISTADLHVGRGGGMAFVASAPDRPAELYYSPSTDARPRRMTDFNAEIEKLDLGRAEEITWEGPDGFEENGILVFPPGFDAGKRYPLVLRIHGGPMAASYKLYHVLDDAGVPVEFIAYPVAGHFPPDPVHQRDVFRRWGDWIARWFDE